MVNVVTAGVISPALSHDPRLLAMGMVLLMSAGLACWGAYLWISRHRPADPTEPAPEIVD